jgi:hypothetical protein
MATPHVKHSKGVLPAKWEGVWSEKKAEVVLGWPPLKRGDRVGEAKIGQLYKKRGKLPWRMGSQRQW